MRAKQPWLFPPPRPLVERLGEEFFRQLPSRPGVYFMCGAAEGVLYVGKAKNLRRRLASYRVANPDRLSRRIFRLLHQVTRIEWDECINETAAHFREELLITVLQPKFNSVGKVWGNVRVRRAESPQQDSPGQRPGLTAKEIPSPERAKQTSTKSAEENLFRPFRARSLSQLEPRALPWAILLWAFSPAPRT